MKKSVFFFALGKTKKDLAIKNVSKKASEEFSERLFEKTKKAIEKDERWKQRSHAKSFVTVIG